MSARVKEIMLSLEDYAVVGEDATIRDALIALRDSQARLPSNRQPHRAVIVKDSNGVIVGKLHHFAFLRALIPEREPLVEKAILEQAGVGDDLLHTSLRTLDLLTADLVDICQRGRSVLVRDVYTSAKTSIDENAALTDAIGVFLAHQTLSLLVHRRGETVGILRLSDLFDVLARVITDDGCL